MVQSKDVTHIARKAKKYGSIARGKTLPLVLILWPLVLLMTIIIAASSLNFLFSSLSPNDGVEFLRIITNIVLFAAGIICAIVGPISILIGIALLAIKRKLK